MGGTDGVHSVVSSVAYSAHGLKVVTRLLLVYTFNAAIEPN